MKEKGKKQSSSGGIRRFPRVQLSDCVRCEKSIQSGWSWDRLRERVCVCDFPSIFIVVLEVEGWTQGIKCFWEVGDIRSKRWRGCGWKNLKNCSELLWILFVKRKASPNRKAACKNCWEKWQTASSPLLTPEKQMDERKMQVECIRIL